MFCRLPEPTEKGNYVIFHNWWFHIFREKKKQLTDLVRNVEHQKYSTENFGIGRRYFSKLAFDVVSKQIVLNSFTRRLLNH